MAWCHLKRKKKKKFLYSRNHQRENLKEILVASQLVWSYKGKKEVCLPPWQEINKSNILEINFSEKKKE